jgi:uncharacterized protein YndB with AHSA1/START domain
VTGGDPVRVTGLTRAPAERVWHWLADPYSYADWVCGTARVRSADADWPAVGSRLQHRFGRWPLVALDHTSVLEAEPPHRLVLAANARPWALVRAEVIVTATATGAHVQLCEQVVGGRIARLPRASRRVQRWRNRRSLAHLIALAEGAEPGRRVGA